MLIIHQISVTCNDREPRYLIFSSGPAPGSNSRHRDFRSDDLTIWANLRRFSHAEHDVTLLYCYAVIQGNSIMSPCRLHITSPKITSPSLPCQCLFLLPYYDIVLLYWYHNITLLYMIYLLYQSRPPCRLQITSPSPRLIVLCMWHGEN